MVITKTICVILPNIVALSQMAVAILSSFIQNRLIKTLTLIDRQL